MAARSLLARMEDILSRIELVRREVEGRTFEYFCANELYRLGIERAIEIVSEASRHISEADKQANPSIPWRNIKVIGNVIRHEYERTNSAIIWDIATVYLEQLEPVIEKLKGAELERLKRNAMQPQTRIEARFAKLAAQKRAALITFITAGDPDLATSRELLLALPAAGADIIELGMPFSDPMADGPAIQASSLRSLRAGHKMAHTLALVRDFRKADQVTPIVLMGYYNPIYVYPVAKFLDDAVAAGVDGLIVVDVPPEADDELCLPALAKGLNFIRLAAPTTDDKRLPAVLANTSGFVYYVSIAGVTGAAAPDVAKVHTQVARIKKQTRLPVAVGFGVRTPEQAKAIAAGADGVVVGSALVSAIAGSLGKGGKPSTKTVTAVVKMVQGLSRALAKD